MSDSEKIEKILSLVPDSELLEESQASPQEPQLELLVSMARSGEIDPWDVDLVYVIDKFLSQLAQKKDEQLLKEAAQIIFFVSVLLRLKSEKIYRRQLREEELLESGDDLIDFDAIEFQEIKSPEDLKLELLNPKSLDRALSRNPQNIRQVPKRPITLDDLIALFEKTKQEIPRVRRKRKESLDDFEGDDEVVMREDEDRSIYELVHEENLEQKIQILSECVLKMLEINRQTPLSSLENYVGDQFDAFLAALFLSHAGKTEISQKTFYDELWLKRIA
ncbi:MAG: segregation/condensation protein A [Candidatus Caenarcaniphilales bacterium]|nr:segregation/condensation protein A [Candidatus Caenarcaniphilales bacterium]